MGKDLPTVGITAGDPAGIGPEIVLKAFLDDAVKRACVPLVIGDISHLRRTAEKLNIPVRLGGSGEEGEFDAFVEDLANVDAGVEFGTETAATGKASAEYIEASVELWRSGRIDCVATAPISKRAIAMAGYEHPGHTEFFAELTGSKRIAMSFFAEDLRVVLLSTHVSLRDAIGLVRTDPLVELIGFADRELGRLLGKKVKLAVAGLNPHASEGGMFGTEESREIEPAILECRQKYAIDVHGPFSPDTIFLRGYKGEFDGIIACYHDQATIAVKSLSFGSSVNVTLGLPLIRTSVDHGTAFDIAGKGVAESTSMSAAIVLGARLSAGKKR